MIRIAIINVGGGLQSLTDCLVSIIIQQFDEVNAPQSPIFRRYIYICYRNIFFELFSKQLHFIMIWKDDN